MFGELVLNLIPNHPSIHPYISSPVWRLSPMAVLTDTPSNTYCRAPGSTQVKAINFSSFQKNNYQLSFFLLKYDV